MSEFGSSAGGGGVQSGPRASFGVRFVAVLIDTVLVGVVGVILSLVLGSTLGSVLNLVLGLAYYGYLEGSPSGQTVGKRAMSIRVIDFNGGGPIGPGRALLRYLGRIVSSIPRRPLPHLRTRLFSTSDSSRSRSHPHTVSAASTEKLPRNAASRRKRLCSSALRSW